MSEVTAVPLRPVGKSGIVALWVGIAALVLIGLVAGWLLARGPSAAVAGGEDFLRYNKSRPGVQVTPSGLQYQVLRKGNGPTPGADDVALIEYRGTLTNGQLFDATKPGQPVPLQINQVVHGFAEGLMLMPKGSTYRLWIPPQLGYGAQQAGQIPANSVLVFDVTLRESASMQAVRAAQGQ